MSELEWTPPLAGGPVLLARAMPSRLKFLWGTAGITKAAGFLDDPGVLLTIPGVTLHCGSATR